LSTRRQRKCDEGPKKPTNREEEARSSEKTEMALHVKQPKACRNKKQSASLLTPPDSSLSSSSGSLSSFNSERKRLHKSKQLRFRGHTTLVVASPKRKKLRTKKSSSTTSGSDSDYGLLRNNNSPDEMNRNSLFSSCKSFFSLFVFN
jgi:hypothetical protein